jgi:hypothetical protein
MTFEMDSLDDEVSADAVDHWLDEALRAVPLPDGFLTRMRTLAERAECKAAGAREIRASPRPREGVTPRPAHR